MDKKLYLPALLAVALLDGCTTPETILLTDDVSLTRREQTGSPAVPAKEVLSPADLGKIEREVFLRLLASPVGKDSGYSAIFLQADEATTTSLIKRFSARVPPIKQLWHLETRPGQSPLDKDTGRAAVILSVDTLEPENGRVMAFGRWFAGEAAAGFHTFELIKTGDDWRIESEKNNSNSSGLVN